MQLELIPCDHYKIRIPIMLKSMNDLPEHNEIECDRYITIMSSFPLELDNLKKFLYQETVERLLAHSILVNAERLQGLPDEHPKHGREWELLISPGTANALPYTISSGATEDLRLSSIPMIVNQMHDRECVLLLWKISIRAFYLRSQSYIHFTRTICSSGEELDSIPTFSASNFDFIDYCYRARTRFYLIIND